MLKFSIFFIALRHIFTRKRQSLLTITGVSIGAMILIATLSMTEGLIENIETTIIEASPNIVINGEKLYPRKEKLLDSGFIHIIKRAKIRPDDKIKGINSLENYISKVDGIKSISPFVEVRAILRYGTKFLPVKCLGVTHDKEALVSPNISKNMIHGKWDDLHKQDNNTLIGRLIAKKLGLNSGQRVRLIDSDGRLWYLSVTGIFKTGLKNIDENVIYLNLNFAQKIKGLGKDTVNGVNIRVKDPHKVKPISQILKVISQRKTETWEEQNQTVLANFRQNNLTTLILVIFTFIVSGFGISNVLNTIVLEKVKDIAILKSMGFTRNKITGIFLLEGLIMGLVGAFIGLITGWLLSVFIGSLPINFGDASFIQSKGLNMVQKPWFYWLTALFSVFIATFSSLLPALKAAKLLPVQVFRGY